MLSSNMRPRAWGFVEPRHHLKIRTLSLNGLGLRNSFGHPDTAGVAIDVL
jgi:hypothetical protein